MSLFESFQIEAGEPHQPISLSSPRQATTRAQNLYVEAPLCGPSSEASLKGLGHKGLPSGSKATGLASVHSGRDRSKGAKGHPIQSTSTTSQCDNSKINHDPFSPASSTNSPVESIGAPALFTTRYGKVQVILTSSTITLFSKLQNFRKYFRN